MDDYQSCLVAGGMQIVEVGGLYWQNYKGILLPAYLPHAVPAGIQASAPHALKASNAMLARWTEHFGQAADSGWWFVMRDGAYSRETLSSNTRSKLSRGGRRLEARQVSSDEILLYGYEVCKAAVSRYGRGEFLPSRKAFTARVEAAALHPSSMEFFGVFRGGDMLAFSENHVQDNGVFLESIWYDPSGLKDYSSYVLIDAILEEYIVHRECRYVSDGSRSIYHETGVHDFLIEKFGFRRVNADMHLMYSSSFALAMQMSRPLKGLAASLGKRLPLSSLRKFEALHFQEGIAMSVRRHGAG